MIRVFDELGNEVNPTYPKRARGLVKQGRARYADDADDVIVLTPNTENENVAYPSDVQHILEDTEMFEYNVNEEINESAEILEPIEAIEEAEEIEPTSNKELNHLYSELAVIDRQIEKIADRSVTMPEDLSAFADMNDAVTAMAEAAKEETSRLKLLGIQYVEMRKDIIRLIEKVKDDAKPQPEPKPAEFDETAYIVELLNMTTESYKTMCQHLDTKLRRGVIELDEYREQRAAVQADCDERIKKLRNTLEALKYGG